MILASSFGKSIPHLNSLSYIIVAYWCWKLYNKNYITQMTMILLIYQILTVKQTTGGTQ